MIDRALLDLRREKRMAQDVSSGISVNKVNQLSKCSDQTTWCLLLIFRFYFLMYFIVYFQNIFLVFSSICTLVIKSNIMKFNEFSFLEKRK